MAAYVKAWNFTKIRLRQGCFFVNFLKIFGTYFDALQEFSQKFSKSLQRVYKNTAEEMFAKYLSADGCFVKATILLKQQYILDFFKHTLILTKCLVPCMFELTDVYYINLTLIKSCFCFKNFLRSSKL